LFHLKSRLLRRNSKRTVWKKAHKKRATGLGRQRAGKKTGGCKKAEPTDGKGKKCPLKVCGVALYNSYEGSKWGLGEKKNGVAFGNGKRGKKKTGLLKPYRR